jgi:hypothetical protein
MALSKSLSAHFPKAAESKKEGMKFAVMKWRKRFVNGESLWKMTHGWEGPLKAISVNLDRPFNSCKRMCQKLRIPTTTCLHILHEDLGFRKCDLRWVPHLMAENEAQCRATFSEDLLQPVCHAKETDFEH